jgi:hypothetical protein
LYCIYIMFVYCIDTCHYNKELLLVIIRWGYVISLCASCVLRLSAFSARLRKSSTNVIKICPLTSWHLKWYVPCALTGIKYLHTHITIWRSRNTSWLNTYYAHAPNRTPALSIVTWIEKHKTQITLGLLGFQYWWVTLV